MRDWTLVFRAAVIAVISSTFSALNVRAGSSCDDKTPGQLNCTAENFFDSACAGCVMALLSAVIGMNMWTVVAHSHWIIFPKDRPCFLREYASNMYSAGALITARTLVEIPTSLLLQLELWVISYWIMDLQGSLWTHVLIGWGVGQATASMALLLGAISRSVNEAMALSPMILLHQTVFSGLLTPLNRIPVSMRWMAYTAPLRYGASLAGLVELGRVHEAIESCKQIHSERHCEWLLKGDFLRQGIMEQQGMTWGQMPLDFILLFGLALVLRSFVPVVLWLGGRHVYS